MSQAFSPAKQCERRLATVAVLWIAFLAWPLLAGNDYVLSLGVYFFINLLLIGGLNLLMGFGGQISLCQAGFFGLGAYVSGVLSVRAGWPPHAGVAAALILSTVSALAIGLPALRLRGNYLAMATLGFNAILTVLFTELVGLTGGPNGLSGIPPIILAGVDFGSPHRFYYLAWAAGGLCMALLAVFLSSRAGRALRAVAASEVAAASMGINAFNAKLLAFMFSAGAAGLAGALYAHFNQYASPETFNFSASVLIVVMVALGGWGQYWGPIFGAAVFTAVPELLHKFQDAELLVFGAGMIVVLLFLPQGIAGCVAPIATRIAAGMTLLARTRATRP